MDYLTALSTLSLVLFAPPHTQSYSSNPRLNPSPITMPLHNLVIDDQHCAWFLVDHVLSAAKADAHETEHSPALEREAEILVWQQIDRAKLFARALGLWFQDADRAGASVCELAELAAAHGLVVEALPSPLYRLRLRGESRITRRGGSGSGRGRERERERHMDSVESPPPSASATAVCA